MVLASRWWALGLGAVVLVCAIIVILGGGATTVAGLTALGVLAAYGVFWAVVARRASDGSALAVIVIVVTVVTAGVLTACSPVLAIFQFIAYPAVWTVARSTALAIVANVAISLSVAAGFLASLGTSPDALTQTALTQGISLAFSLVMGFWISRIAERSEERRALIERLTATQDELAVLHRDAGVTSERERLARDLHDTIAQTLTGLVMLGQQSRRELEAGTLTDATLAMIEDGARDALVETRSLVAAGAPAELGAGIADALRRLGERFEREAGIRVVVSAEVVEPRHGASAGAELDRDTQVVLLRCVQEGLANVRKHAEATSARVDLRITERLATVRIVDDGRGFDPSGEAAGFGLRGLRDRLGLVGGELTVDGTAGATTLEARLPLGAAA